MISENQDFLIVHVLDEEILIFVSNGNTTFIPYVRNGGCSVITPPATTSHICD